MAIINNRHHNRQQFNHPLPANHPESYEVD
jgi:hypothetical protein